MSPATSDIRIGTLIKGEDPRIGDTIRSLLPHGFESFEITFWRTLGGVDLRRLADEVMGAIDGQDVVISALGCYGNTLGTDPLGQETWAGLQAVVEAAPLFGCRTVSAFTGRLVDRPLRESVSAVAERFAPLLDRAGELGLSIAFENCAMDGDWRRGDFNIAHDPWAWELLFEALPQPNVGLEWEPCHQMLALIDPVPQIAAWGHRFVHVHGKDANIHWDMIRRSGIHGEEPYACHRTPGYGDSDWSMILAELRRAGFRGSIDIEGWHDPVMRDDLEIPGQLHALSVLKAAREAVFSAA
jgi:sugar phosphate isomerase/epimerase